VIRLTDVTLSRAAHPLLEHANLTVHAGHRVGLVGPNGSGKSSLFAALRGELLPDAGSIALPPRWTIAHVAQETPALPVPAVDFVQDGDRELREVERALAAAGSAKGLHTGAAEGAELAELHHRFEAIGGYGAPARAATLLAGLGFTEARQHDPVDSFSGGWRMRLNLAQALMCRSDLLLLDEPTNHLDLDAVLWLEDWLLRYPGTLLLVTHDRDFLDATVDTIVHLDHRALKSYTGNYAQFERERASQLALQQATHAKQERQVAHLRGFIDRFRAKATKARQVQSRIKALERMETIAAAHVDSPFSFAFTPTSIGARQLVRLEGVTLGYDERPAILTDVEWSVLAGARIGLLGPNGAGKSTLLKAVAGALRPLRGTRWTAQNLRIGYFAQHQVEQLRADESALRHFQRFEPETREQELRDFLGGFDFGGAHAQTPAASLSGGEKARLTLALLVRQKPNLLLLDEPTNHLDIEMREALTEALQDYDGALIVVAHDRHLLRATTDELWLVHDGRVGPFDGDLDDYREFVLAQRRRMQRPAGPPEDASSRGDRRARKREEALARQQRADVRKPYATRQAAIEAELAGLAAEKEALDAWLATSEAYAEGEKARLVDALERNGMLTWSLARLESEWLEIAETLEKLDAAPG